MNQFPAIVKRHLRSQGRDCLDGLPLLTPMSALGWHTCSRRQLLMAEDVQWFDGIQVSPVTEQPSHARTGRDTGLGLLPAPFSVNNASHSNQTAINFPAMR